MDMSVSATTNIFCTVSAVVRCQNTCATDTVWAKPALPNTASSTE